VASFELYGFIAMSLHAPNFESARMERRDFTEYDVDFWTLKPTSACAHRHDGRTYHAN